MESNNGFRLNASEVEILAGGVANSVVTNFQILEILYEYRLGLITLDIGKKLKDKYENDISRRSLQEKLQLLNEVGVIERKVEGAGYKFKLGDIFRSSSIRYSDDQLRTFSGWKEILDTYDYIPFIGDIKSLLNQLDDFNKQNELFSVVDLPKIEYKGKEHINNFFEAIEIETKIDFTYEKISGDEIEIKEVKDFMPYLLKEHNRRWYVIGKKEVGGKFIIYALERIKSCKLDKIKNDVFDREEFSSNDIFKHSMGIFTGWQKTDKKHDQNVKTETVPVSISFKVKDGSKFNNISYLLTNKIHSSQDVSKPDEEGWVTIKLKMFPEADLIREIRKIGLHCVKDIKPKWFEKWVKEL